MIFDGYNETVELGKHTLVYRPLTEDERLQLAAIIARAGESDAAEIHERFVTKHIVFWSGPQTDDILPILEGNADREKRDAENLYVGTLLQARWPHLGLGFDCRTCQTKWYIPRANKFALRGEHRPEDQPVPCETTTGCPRGHYSDPVCLSPKNEMAFKHYRRCVATGSFPDDPIVSRNAAIIRKALNDAARGVDPETRSEPHSRPEF